MIENRPPSHRHRTREHRRGVTIIPVIAFYAVALALVGNWVSAALSHQKLVRRWHEKSQVVLLAEAGLRRAAAQLATNPEYEGERWLITADELAAASSADIEIQISPATEQEASSATTEQVRIVAIACYPAGDSKRVQATKTLTFQTANASSLSGESP